MDRYEEAEQVSRGTAAEHEEAAAHEDEERRTTAKFPDEYRKAPSVTNAYRKAGISAAHEDGDEEDR